MNRKLMTTPLLALGFASLAACAVCAPAAEPRQPHEADPKLSVPAKLAGDRLALDMFRELAATQKGSICFSPASLEAVLQLLREGAAGRTRAEFDALGMGRPGVASAMQVQSANALFAAEGLALKPGTKAPVQRTDFADVARAAEGINDWCDDKTHGLIPEIVQAGDLDPLTRLVVVNAVYLKEKWLRPFNERATDRQGVFHRADGSRVTKPLMQQTADFRYAEGDDWQAVALFYRRDGRPGEPACFIGILPRGNARDFAKGLTVQKYDAIRRALATDRPQKVSVTLPKMDVDSGVFPLKEALQKLGLRRAFGEADFSGLTDERIRIDKLLQRCHVIVNERETEAAAVTAAVMKAYGLAPAPPKVIRFDRPFVWAIGDLTTDAPPFFLGLCEEP